MLPRLSVKRLGPGWTWGLEWAAWRYLPALVSAASTHLPSIAVALGFGLLLAACSDQNAERQKAADVLPPVPVSVVSVSERPTNPGITFIGRVEAIFKVDLVARVQGFLTKRAYIEGQLVQAGDLLFELERETYQAQVDAARANLAKAEADADNAKTQADRARVLIKDQTVSQSVLDDRIAQEKQTQATVQQTRAALEQATINLGYTEIRAPFAGRVGQANFSVGALVGPTTGPLATIVSQDPIYVTFQVSDRTILQLTEGDRAKASAEDAVVRLYLSTGQAYPETGTIDYTGVKVDPNTDTLTVRAKFQNPTGTLVDGQYARVFVESKNPVESLVIPQRAILTDQGGNFVMLVDAEKKAVQRRVTTGQTIGADVIVRTGLKQDEIVITDGLQRVRPGQVVDPAPAEQVTQPAGK